MKTKESTSGKFGFSRVVIKRLSVAFFSLFVLCLIILWVGASQAEKKVEPRRNPGFASEGTNTVIVDSDDVSVEMEVTDEIQLQPMLVGIPQDDDGVLLVSQTEVTRGNYYALIDNSSKNRVNHPIDSLNIDEVVKYLNRLSEIEGYDSCYECSHSCIQKEDCLGYRLPTKREWLMLSKGAGRLGGKLEDIAWIGKTEAQLVGKKKANGLLLYDMYGNVKEFAWNVEEPERPWIMGCGFKDKDCKEISTLADVDTKADDIGFRFVRYTSLLTPEKPPSKPEVETKPVDVSDMAPIAASEFWMGCVPGDSQCDEDEKPRHKVYLDAYYIDKKEVTVAAYRSCVNAGQCKYDDTNDSDCNYEVSGKEQHPMNCVSWYQADSYCKFVNKRLPTEAEWERAARLQENDIYPWGMDRPTKDLAVFEGSSGTLPVASKPAAAHGLFDMAGNVWEWVQDCYDEDVYKQRSVNSLTKNPVNSCSSDGRVLRGGSYYDSGEWLRSSDRSRDDPGFRNWFDGFRCALSMGKNL